MPTEIHSPTFKLADAILFDGVQQPLELPEHAFEGPPIPSMICPQERRFRHYLTHHCYTGAGAVVDLGRSSEVPPMRSCLVCRVVVSIAMISGSLSSIREDC